MAAGPPSTAIRFRVLGPLEHVDGNGDVVPLRSPALRRLLALLLVHRGNVVPTDRIADVVWGVHQPAHPTAALQSLISRLRRALGGHAADALLTRAPGYLLAAPRGSIDAGCFADLVRLSQDAVATERFAEAAELLDRALALWRGRAYAEFADDDFARAEAVRLDEMRIAAAEDRVDADLALNHAAAAANRAEALAAEHPLRERPHLQLMLAWYRAGRQPDALEVYRRYRERLIDELAVAPSAAVQRLHGEILRQLPDLDWMPPAGSASPTAAADTAASGRLAPPTALIGRERELDELGTALGRARIVTVGGVGGVGKTLLALHAAGAAAGTHADGAWLVELAAVRDPAAVADAISTTLAVQQRAGLDTAGRLVEFLRPKRLLLVLDNCEHVIGAVAGIVEAVIGGCPTVTVLATSREPLGVTGEHVRPLAPLAVPPPGVTDPDTAGQSPSVRLLLERAAATAPDFGLDRSNLRDVVDICRRLDGLPLAIELAAPKLRLMSARELAERLDARFPLLRSGRRIVAERQRTLYAVVDWSYRLLDDDERRVFEWLTVFAGPFALVAAEQVCAGLVDDPADATDIVLGLVERSMLVADVGSAGADCSRYTFLETVRAFGRDRLVERGEVTAASHAHAEWAAAFAESAETGLQGRDEARWVRALASTTDDLRAAHGWALEHDLDLAIGLVAALFWYAEFHVAEMLGWAERTIKAAERADASHPRLPVAYAMAAVFSRFHGDMARTRALALKGLALTRDTSDPAGWYPRNILLDVEFFSGRLAEAQVILVELERDTRNAGARYPLTVALWMHALVAAYRDDRVTALRYAEQAQHEAKALANPSMIAWASYSEAEILLDADPGRAIRLLDEATALGRAVDNRYLVGVALISAASVYGRHGDPRQALRRFRDVLAVWHEAGGWIQLWTAMRSVVELLARVGADEDAAVLLHALSASPTAAPAFGADAERLTVVRDTLTRRLGADRLTAASRRGESLDDDAAVAAAFAAIDTAARDPR